MVTFNKKKGSANSGRAPAPKQEPTPDHTAGKTRVRILIDIKRSKLGTFKTGEVVYLTPRDARNLIGFGLAEEDKSITKAPETKRAASPKGEQSKS